MTPPTAAAADVLAPSSSPNINEPAAAAAATAPAEAGAAPQPAGTGTAGAPAEPPRPKRKKASRACKHCQRAHLTCDDARPCARCWKKGLQATCTDGARKKAKYLLEEDELLERRASEERAQAARAAAAAASTADGATTSTGASNGSPAVEQTPAVGTPPPPAPPSSTATAGGLDAPPTTEALAGSSIATSQPSTSMDMSLDDPTANVLFPTSAGLPSYAGAGSFDSPASAGTHPSAGGGGSASVGGGSAGADGTYVSMLDADPSFNTSFHPFGTENASLEYSMLSSMIYGSGIDPSLLGSGLDDLGLGGASFYGDATGAGGGAGGVPSPGGGLAMTPSMGAGMYDGTSGGAGIVGSVMYDGTSGGAGVGSASADSSSSPWSSALPVSDPLGTGVGTGLGGVGVSSSLFDPVLAPAVTSMASPSLAVNSFAPAPDPLVGLASSGAGTAPSLPTLAPGGVGPASMQPLPPPPQPTSGASQTLALQKFATPNPHLSPDTASGVTLNSLLRLRPEEEDWDTRIRRVHTDRIEPFHYTDGYHFLINYVTSKFEREEALRVVRALAIIRPSLIALQMPLSEEDEIFVERSIQRMALEFEKLIAFSGTPTVVWRRTCEICVVGTEFSMLTHWPREELIGKHIYQFLDKKSTIEYWEKFAMHAFENTSQSVVIRCVLLTPQGKPVPCSACFSIKRDMFDLPSLIVGNFLPIL